MSASERVPPAKKHGELRASVGSVGKVAVQQLYSPGFRLLLESLSRFWTGVTARDEHVWRSVPLNDTSEHPEGSALSHGHHGFITGA